MHPSVMRFNSLILFLTNKCLSGCSTCNINAVPGNTGMLGSEDIDVLFGYLSKRGCVNKFIVWTGGEPIENFPTLKYGLARADKYEYKSEILTSGYWYRDRPFLLEELKEHGPFSLRISVDSEHLEFSEPEILSRLACECIDKGIEVNFTVREIEGDGDLISELLRSLDKAHPDYLRKKSGDPRWIHRIPHVPVSGIGCNPDKGGYSISRSGCRMVFRDLVVGWDGNIYPCCGLFSLSGFEKFAVGYIGGSDILWEGYDRAWELFRQIKEKGITVIAERAGSGDSMKKRYLFRNQCHACLSLLRDFPFHDKKIPSG